MSVQEKGRFSRYLVGAISVGVSLATFACKPRQEGANLASVQSLHMGGVPLLWFTDNDYVFVRSCASAITDTSIETKTLDDFRNACPLRAGSKEVNMRKEDFVKVAVDAMLNDTGFKSLVKSQASIAELDRLITLKVAGDGLVSNANEAQKIFAEYETVAEKLKGKQEEAERMEALVTTGVQAARGTEAVATAQDFKDMFGDAYQTVQKDLTSYKTEFAQKDKNLKQLVARLKGTYQLYLDVQDSLTQRFSKIADNLADPKIQTVSMLGPDTLNYAIFSSVAMRYGLLDGDSGLVARPTCVADPGQNAKAYAIQGADGYKFSYGSNYYYKEGCERAVQAAKGNFICVIGSVETSGTDKVLYSYVYNLKNHKKITPTGILHDFCLKSIAYPNAKEVCGLDGQTTNIFDGEGRLVEKTANDWKTTSINECFAKIGKKYPGASYNPAVTASVPAGVLSPTQTVSGFNIGQFLQNQGAPVSQPATTNNATNNTTPTNSNTSSSGVTMADVTAAIQKNVAHYSQYNADTGTVDACKGAGQSAGWTATMQSYYCSLPIFKDFPGSNTPGERHCFTGTVRAEGPYASLNLKGKYLEAANYCMGQTQFQWINSSGQKDIFTAVMGKKQF